MKLSVWAPFAKSVVLVTLEDTVPLRPDSTPPINSGDDTAGYWRADIDASLLEKGYRFSIDGGRPLPDPRSRWQPDGVHGASYGTGPLRRERTAHSVGRDPSLRGAVIYEMHVGTFTAEGTYAAAQEKLPHLVELGVTHVELMPLATFPGSRGWGYDGVDLFAPFPAYGTPQDLAAFIDACHERRLCVLLDVVYNHLGPDGNYLGQFGPYFTERYKTGWGAAINFDGPHSEPVRRFVIDNALMWLRDYEFDGLRLDAVHAIFSLEAVHVLEDLAVSVKALGEELNRKFILIAESDLNDPRLVRSRRRGGMGLDAQWTDDFHHAVHHLFTKETAGYYADYSGLSDVATALRDGYVFQGQYSPHRQRRHGRPPTGVAAHQLVVAAQNHDQIGNRAQGERLGQLLGPAQLKAVAALTLLSPFAVLLFQGEEWGATNPFLYFTDHQDLELGRLVAEGRSREFSSFRWAGAVPNPQELNTFLRSKLNWAELGQTRGSDMYEWYRQLTRLRRENVSAQGKAAVKFDLDKRWLRFVHGSVCVAVNVADREQRVPIPQGDWLVALSSDGAASVIDGSDGMPGGGTRIYRRR